MKQFFQRMGERVARFFYGRYGNDRLNNVLLLTALVLLLLAYLPHMGFLLFFSLALLIWSNFRALSRNIFKRRRELTAFLGFWSSIRSKLSLRKKILRERKTHCYFKCPSCKAVLRVPKGKGEIDVTCPKCKTVTLKKT